MTASDRAALAAAFDRQGRVCSSFDAPLYAELCRRCAIDIAAGGPIAALVGDWPGDPVADALALRLLAALHARVLQGTAPALAAHYPSAGGAPRWPDAWRAFVDAATAEPAAVRAWLRHPPQTNEVGRSAPLAAGFLFLSAGRPLHLRELGASAGLNLRWDRYRYRFGAVDWGDAGATVVLRPEWRGAAPPPAPIEVASRRGCDLRPIDVRDPAARRRLLAFVWPDHDRRLANLRAALASAADDDLRLDAEDAADWLDRVLAEPAPAGDLVVFHSTTWTYLPQTARHRIADAIAAAGLRWPADRGLHWLSWEDDPDDATGTHRHALRLRSWPARRDLVLARGRPHGDQVEWLGSAGR